MYVITCTRRVVPRSYADRSKRVPRNLSIANALRARYDSNLTMTIDNVTHLLKHVCPEKKLLPWKQSDFVVIGVLNVRTVTDTIRIRTIFGRRPTTGHTNKTATSFTMRMSC